jgi:hypothetical protein
MCSKMAFIKVVQLNTFKFYGSQLSMPYILLANLKVE